MTLELKKTQDGVVLRVKAHAGGKSDSLGGIHDGALKVCVTQIAEKGKANMAIRELLSQHFGIPKSAVRLLSGASSANKTFLIHGLGPDEICSKLPSDDQS